MVTSGGTAISGPSTITGYVHFTANNRFHSVPARCVVKLDSPEEVAVIGQSQGRHIAFRRLPYHVINAVGTVQQTVVAMKM